VLLAHNLVAPDRAAAEEALIELAGDGELVREPLGDDALWHLPGHEPRGLRAAVAGLATA
jgi:hypothetical protein